jgi:hypothetical protein
VLKHDKRDNACGWANDVDHGLEGARAVGADLADEIAVTWEGIF